MIKLYTFLFITVSLINCKPSVYKSYAESDESTDCGLTLVRIHPPDSVAEQIGEILIDDIGTAVNCGEESTINYIKSEACSRNAQIVLIKQIKRPDEDSYCFRCTAVFYKYKPGAKAIKASNYYNLTKIKKREQKDRKNQVTRTTGIIHVLHHFFHFMKHLH